MQGALDNNCDSFTVIKDVYGHLLATIISTGFRVLLTILCMLML